MGTKQQQQQQARGLRIAFVHPDLGLGGAERLVVDAAAELVKHGHHVDMYTAHYDPGRCFEETRTGGFAVHIAGSWFPRSIFGRAIAACAYIRCLLVALAIAWRSWTSPREARYDAVFADQVSVVVPALKLLLPGRPKVLFYCHFPDLLLSTKRTSTLKRLYRAPLDAIEEATTGAADLVLVNSNFTKGVFADTFKRLAKRGLAPAVLYPAVSIPAEAELAAAAEGWASELDPELVAFIQGGPMLLSINRFERKKGIGLALEALAELLQQRPESCGVGQAQGQGAGGGLRLVVAGGYDVRLAENVEHLEELRALTAKLNLQQRVRFLPSFNDRQRTLLLAACTAVVYTPQHEHFGIVPLEAMAAGRPVLACDSGGPKESVRSGETGLLAQPTPGAFADAMAALLAPGVAGRMGGAARAHVAARFSRGAFGQQLDAYVRGMVAGSRAR